MLVLSSGINITSSYNLPSWKWDDLITSFIIDTLMVLTNKVNNKFEFVRYVRFTTSYLFRTAHYHTEQYCHKQATNSRVRAPSVSICKLNMTYERLGRMGPYVNLC